jgi:hypothetical protein
MMGRRERGQGQFFYAFDLDKVVPADHLVRQIDGVLDLDWVHKDRCESDQSGRGQEEADAWRSADWLAEG